MNIHYCFSHCDVSRIHKFVRRSFLMVFLLVAHVSLATNHYLTFNDGHLLVFPDTCLKLMTTTEDQVTITTTNGQVFTYPLSSIISISEELTKALPTITAYKFNNKYNFQVITDAIGEINDHVITAEVLGIGKWLTPSFTLSDDDARAFVDGKEQVSKESRLHFDTCRVYTVAYPGDLILTKQETGNYGYEPFGNQYTVIADFLTDRENSIPRIDINTVNGENITSRDYYLDAEIIIDGVGIYPSMTDSVKIKGRGHSSWSNDPTEKNPYRLKFDSKKKPLGLTKGKSWVLLANKITGSQLTNAIGMKAASLIGTEAPNHIIPVNLYINGTYKGSYNFTENVGLANNSVVVEDETVATLLKMEYDYTIPAEQKFRSTPYQIFVIVKDPDFDGTDETLLTLNDIKLRFNSFAAAVQDSTDLAVHVDMESMARYLMFNELICNYEIFHTRSWYCYHDNILSEDGRLFFGPAWDFDWGYGYETNRNYYRCDPAIDYYYAVEKPQSEFFRQLRYNSWVARRLYFLWKDLVDNHIDELCDFCLEYYQYAAPTLELNKTGAYDPIDYSAQCVRASNWLRNRANAMLAKMKAEIIQPGDVDCDGDININDVVSIINYLLSGNSEYVDIDFADVDSDGNVNIQDVSSLIQILLNSSSDNINP